MAVLTEVNWSARDPLMLLLFLSCSWVSTCVHNRNSRLWQSDQLGTRTLDLQPLLSPSGKGAWSSARTYVALAQCISRRKGNSSLVLSAKLRKIWYRTQTFNSLIDCQLKQLAGNRIRITPNQVMFRSPAAYHAIYSTKANVKRSEFYDAMVRTERERSTIATTDPAAHAKRRKLLNQAFTDKSLKASAAFMAKHIDRWIELLISDVQKDGWTPTKDVSHEVDMLVFDILGDICYGKSSDVKEPGKNPLRVIPHATMKSVQFGYPVSRICTDSRRYTDNIDYQNALQRPVEGPATVWSQPSVSGHAIARSQILREVGRQHS